MRDVGGELMPGVSVDPDDRWLEHSRGQGLLCPRELVAEAATIKSPCWERGSPRPPWEHIGATRACLPHPQPGSWGKCSLGRVLGLLTSSSVFG